MLNFIFAGLANEIVRDVISGHEKETSRNPFLQPIEDEIERFERIEKQAKERLEALRQFHHWVAELFEPAKPDKNDSPQNPENTETPKESGQPEPATEDTATNTPTPKRGRKPKEKLVLEFKRLPKHRSTGNPRLDALETALRNALEGLNSTKMAYHFKAITEVRLALTELYESWDKPEDERLAELEAGLKDAADKLSTNPSAARSKAMRNIWSDIVVALQDKGGNE